MTAASIAVPKNSTTVRIQVPPSGGERGQAPSFLTSLAGFAEWLAPSLVLDRAFDAWCRPPRPKNPRAPRDGRPFEIDSPVGTMKAYEWGMRDDGETVLLVHGWGGSAVTMEKLAPQLAERGYQVVAIDLPAHGQSEGETTNLVELTRAVEAALWRLRPSAVIAHSLGASATALALEHGPRVERVVLLAPGEDVSYFAHAFAARAGLSQGIGLGLLGRIEQYVGLAPDSLSLRHHAPPQGTGVLLVHDPADVEVPWTHAQTIAGAWPQAQLIAAPGVGHHLMPRKAEVMSAAVQFVAEGTVPGATIRVIS